jgi:hypothetical protein
MNLDRSFTDPNKYDLMAVAAHEIDEVLGFGSALNGSSNGAAAPTGPIFGLDLYRYASPGVRSFNTDASSIAYFSIDNGATNLVGFNQDQRGDFSDWFSITAHSVRIQDAFGTPGATPDLGVELRALDVLGYDETPEPGTAALMSTALLALFLARRASRAPQVPPAA